MTALALSVVLFSWLYLAGTVVAAGRFARRPSPRSAARPAVSVLKPLHGAEPGLYDNLRSFVAQDYDDLQIVLGVGNPHDTALPAARSLVGDLPDRDIALVVEPRVRGSNLKVANLENMLPVARHGILVLADSDMRVDRGYLAAIVPPLLEARTGIVTCLYKGVSTGGLWSALGALHINFGFLPAALVGETLGAGGGCFGATIALRRDTLDAIGGFAPLRDELADDHRLGALVRERGFAIVLAPYLVEDRVAEPTFAALWRHELRWARTLRAVAPLGFAGSALTHTVAIALLAATVSGWGLTASLLVLISLLLRAGVALATARLLRLSTAALWLLPLRDLLSFAVFVVSFCGRSVTWRDRLFRVESSGRMTVEGDKAA